jgi:hypothetical protein
MVEEAAGKWGPEEEVEVLFACLMFGYFLVWICKLYFYNDSLDRVHVRIFHRVCHEHIGSFYEHDNNYIDRDYSNSANFHGNRDSFLTVIGSIFDPFLYSFSADFSSSSDYHSFYLLNKIDRHRGLNMAFQGRCIQLGS